MHFSFIKSHKSILLTLLVCAMLWPMAAQNVGIIPAPQQVTLSEGSFDWDNPTLVLPASFKDRAVVLQQYKETFGNEAVTAANAKKASDRPLIEFILDKKLTAPENAEQAYELEVSPRRIAIRANSDQGLFYGFQSLRQLYRYNYRKWFDKQNVTIPCVQIQDWPSLEVRAWMDDLSRGPITTMEFLKKQITTLAEFKLNALTLYTEHVFKSSAYDYAPADALSPEEISELCDFAAQYHIEVIGNQQCFAHFEKILCNPKYDYLADTKYNLNPANPQTYRFLEDVLKEEMAAYKAPSIYFGKKEGKRPLFNINCDETESLGTGKASAYVKERGAGNVYAEHINKVYNIVSRQGRRTAMWGDIVLKDSEIMRQLPKDILMLVWSYVPSDSFEGMIRPIKEAGFDFMVVPGVSMWSTVFPIMPAYEKNICNMTRDGYLLGAKGVINTAWNDSGEALVSSAWHALGWGAEMAWKPIRETNVQEAENERNSRLSVFDTNFNFQFFHFYNNENIIADFLRTVSTYENSLVREIYNASAIWNFQPLQFLPPNLTSDVEHDIKRERFELIKTIELLKLILSEEAQYENADIIYDAVYAANRMLIDAMMRRFQFTLYNQSQQPGLTNEKDLLRVLADVKDLTTYINSLKHSYLQLWNNQYRNYWIDTNLQKYDRLIDRLNEAPQQVMFTTTTKENAVVLSMRTLFNNLPIHYTTDGSEPTAQSPVYERPIALTQPCTVKTLTIADGRDFREYRNDSILEVRNERYVEHHKGIGALTKLDAQYSTYRAAYSGGGENALFDGNLGSSDYKDGKWQGFQGQDARTYLHFNTPTDINSLTVRYLHNFYDWIMAPQDVEIWTSNDGSNYQLAHSRHFEVEQVSGNRIGTLDLDNLQIKGIQYIYVVVKNPGVLPAEHGAAGNPSYIFMDEIIVR